MNTKAIQGGLERASMKKAQAKKATARLRSKNMAVLMAKPRLAHFGRREKMWRKRINHWSSVRIDQHARLADCMTPHRFRNVRRTTLFPMISL